MHPASNANVFRRRLPSLSLLLALPIWLESAVLLSCHQTSTDHPAPSSGSTGGSMPNGSTSGGSTSGGSTSDGSAALPPGVTLENADIDPPTYWAKWKNHFPADSGFMPIGVYPAEQDPAQLSAIGVNYFMPMRDDTVGEWRPVWNGPGPNDMTHVDATPNFYGGGAFFLPYPGTTMDWGSRAAFNVYGDELDGNGSQFFEYLPAAITAHNQTQGGVPTNGLTGDAFVAANNAAKAADPSRPVEIGVTGTLIDGYHDWAYTRPQKKTICASADILSFDQYPLPAGDPIYQLYDDVVEARSYCQHVRPVVPVIEMGNFPGSSVYPSPAETVAEVWNSIIAGAAYFQYFDYYGNLTDPTFTGNGQYPAGAMFNAVKTVNAQVTALAPVIYSPTADGYVTSSGQMSLMTKYAAGQFYVFAVPHQAGAQTITFTVVDAAATTATVLNENRTIPVANHQFVDSFADVTTVHLYKIN